MRTVLSLAFLLISAVCLVQGEEASSSFDISTAAPDSPVQKIDGEVHPEKAEENQIATLLDSTADAEQNASVSVTPLDDTEPLTDATPSASGEPEAATTQESKSPLDGSGSDAEAETPEANVTTELVHNNSSMIETLQEGSGEGSGMEPLAVNVEPLSGATETTTPATEVSEGATENENNSSTMSDQAELSDNSTVSMLLSNGESETKISNIESLQITAIPETAQPGVDSEIKTPVTLTGTDAGSVSGEAEGQKSSTSEDHKDIGGSGTEPEATTVVTEEMQSNETKTESANASAPIEVEEGSGETSPSVPEVENIRSAVGDEPELILTSILQTIPDQGSGESPSTENGSVTAETTITTSAPESINENLTTESSTASITTEQIKAQQNASKPEDAVDDIQPEISGEPSLITVSTGEHTPSSVEGTAQVKAQETNEITQRSEQGVPVNSQRTLESKIPEKWRPFIMDCSNEVDDRGSELCVEWASGGLCTTHRATMFLFCRKTCLCTGPPSSN